jgi:hypothetical protein
MARNKSRDKKEFLFAQRKKIGPGYLNTPVWIIQKAGKRIWNRRQKRNWKMTEFGQQFKDLQLKKENETKLCVRKGGKINKSARFVKVKKTRNTTYIKK